MARDEQRAALAARWRRNPRSHRMPSGSRPFAGSSRMMTRGSPSRAAARPESLPHAHRVAACALARRGQDAHEARASRPRDWPGSSTAAARVSRWLRRCAWMEVGRLEAPTRRRRGVGDVVVATPLDGCGALGRTDQPEEHPQGRRLARAVRAEEAGDPAGYDIEVEVVDGSVNRPNRWSVAGSIRPRSAAAGVAPPAAGCAGVAADAAVTTPPSRPPKGDSWCASNSTTAPTASRVHIVGAVRAGCEDAVTEWLLLLAAILLTGGTAVFVAAEFSLVALDRPTVQKAIDAGDGRAGSSSSHCGEYITQAVRGPGRHHHHDSRRRLPRPAVDPAASWPARWATSGWRSQRSRPSPVPSPSCWRPPSRWSSASCSHSSSASRRP